ncbi:MAG: hypothetical protein WBB28_12465 [Crinalium sp.]
MAITLATLDSHCTHNVWQFKLYRRISFAEAAISAQLPQDIHADG